MATACSRFIRLPAALVALGLVAAACGSSPPPAASPQQPAPTTTASPPDATLPPATTSSIPPPAAEQVLPPVEVIDLASDARVNVASLAPAATPVLIWFWAPH